MKLLSLLVPASVIAVLTAGRPLNGTIFADLTIEAHRTRQSELLEQQQNIVAQADADRRELSVEERGQLDTLSAEFERLEGEIVRRERLAAQQERLTTPQPRITAAEPIPGDEEEETPAPARSPRAAVPALSAARQIARPMSGNGGFRSFGDYAQAVVRGSIRGGTIDPRLLQGIRGAAATSFTQEAVGADGGFLVPTDFLNSIIQTISAEDTLLGRTNPLSVSGNSIVVPMDETSQWGTGGIKAYWTDEAAAITQSKVALKQVQVRLNKLAALVPVTEEMLEDAPAIDSYLRQKTPDALDWQITYALVWGTGAGQPLGIMNSPALVTVAAEGGQTADTINATNVSKMFARLPARSQQNAVWLINPDAQVQLPLMTIANQPVYMPPGGLSEAPLGRLLGRPVIPAQVASTVGDLGDIMLVDWTQYLTAIKSGGVRLQVSIHLWFDQDISAFKFTLRIAGQPYWSASMAPRSGTNNIAPFVTLAAR